MMFFIKLAIALQALKSLKLVQSSCNKATTAAFTLIEPQTITSVTKTLDSGDYTYILAVSDLFEKSPGCNTNKLECIAVHQDNLVITGTNPNTADYT